MGSIRMRLVLVLVLVFTLVVSVTQAQDDKVLRILSNADIRTSDPHVAYETETWPTAALFYTGLVRWSDDNTELVPALAETYTISEDGLVYSFTLRPGLKFSDGSDLTTEDVKYSFERMFIPATLSPTAYMFEAITGSEAVVDESTTDLAGVQIVDDLTVEFHLDYPVYSLIQRFALAPGFIMSKDAVEAAGDNVGRAPMGAGPFMLETWESGRIITGVRNPNYYLADKPYFDRFEMELGVEPSVGILRIEAGEADIALDYVPNADYPRLSADPVLSQQLIRLAGFPNIDYIIFNTTIEPFNNPDVRKALAMAVDRERLVQILNGRAVPAAGPIPPTVLGDNKELQPPAFDLEGAKALLTSAGYPDGFTAEVLVNTDPTNLSIIQAVIGDWSQIGVTLNMTSVDNAQFLDTVINQPDILQVVMTNWYLDYPDPSNIWEPLLQCGGSYNWGQFCSEELDAAFEVANNIPPGDERWAAFSDFEALIADAMPNVFLEHQANYYFVSSRLNLQSDPATLMRWDAATVK